jgi:O-antigen biosynthesis protein
MLISRQCLETIGAFDVDYGSSLFDADYCLRAKQAGFRTIWTPLATVRLAQPEDRVNVAEPDIERLRRRHPSEPQTDPSYSPWYSTDRPTPAIVLRDRVPEPR